MPMKELTPFGHNIRIDSNGRICATDIWKKFGAVKKKDFNTWQKRESAIEFIDFIKTSNPPEMVGLDLVSSKSGNQGGTYAYKQISLAYAKWLSPEAHKMVNDVFFERIEEEKNPQLAVDRAVNSWKKKGKSDSWISNRLISKAARNTFTSTLGSHGVQGFGYRLCTNSIYGPLLGGSAEVVRVKKDLPEKSNLRESMSEEELLAVSLAEKLSAKNIENNKIYGNNNCAKECMRTSNIIAEAVKISLSTR